MAKFLWRVAVNGYEWRSGGHLAAVGDWDFREYAPLDEFSGLFRTFADTPTTQEGVLAFAKRFGHLGFGIDGDLLDEGQPRSDEEWRELDQAAADEPNWEPFDNWCEEIVRLRECVEVWDRAQNGSADEPTMRRLQETVSNGLRRRTRVSFARHRRVGGFVLEIVPVNLLGAIWLQLAQTISGSKRHRACHVCKTWFEVSPQKYRKSRLYCSEACRSQAYRERKEQALKLAGEGKTAKEIAEELGSDVKTVKGWVSKRKG
jgi:hypothetical protein